MCIIYTTVTTNPRHRRTIIIKKPTYRLTTTPT